MSFVPKTEPALVLAQLIKLSNSNTQYDYKVRSFLNILSWELDLEHAFLLTLDKNGRILNHLWLAEALVPRLSPIADSDNILWRCLNNRQSYLVDPPDFEDFPPDWFSFLEPYKNCFMAIPLADDKTAYGVLALLSSRAYEVHPVQTLLVEAAANELSIAVKNHEQANENKKRLSVLNVLSELGRTLSSTIEVDKVMTMIPEIAVGIFLADGCTLNVLDEGGTGLIYSSQYGTVPPSYNFARYKGARSLPSSVAKAVARDTSFYGYLKDDIGAFELLEEELDNTIISCPLSFQGHHQGCISLFNKRRVRTIQGSVTPQVFDRDDQELLFSMNNMISGVIENALTFKEVESLAEINEKMVSYLSTIYDISSAMMTTVRYDELIWIISRALTDRRGLSFDQALILLLDNREGQAPILKSSAYWAYDSEHEYFEKSLPLEDMLKSPSLDEAKLMLEKGESLGVSIPLDLASEHVLSKVMLEKKPLLGFSRTAQDGGINLKIFGLTSYAAVPMIAKNREVGIIVVDRSLSKKELGLEDLRELTMLANQAALAIENVRLYDDLKAANKTLSEVRNRLIEVEKQAAMGEMGTHLAHEVRNPLVSIGGFTQRLLKKMDVNDPLRKYTEVIWAEVERLNKVINNVLDFSRDAAGRVVDFKMEKLLDEALASLKHQLEQKKINVIKDIPARLPWVAADDRQVMHVILNIFYNATSAMSPKGGDIYVRLFEKKEGDQAYVACEITDTGPGIPPDMLANIFSPFFTSKRDGTGLGLSIVNKIVERYHGLISVDNHPPHIKDSGASFTFMFPVSQGGGCLIP